LKDNSKIKEEYLDKFMSNSLTEINLSSDTNIKYKISFEKICRMYKNAVENGFASVFAGTDEAIKTGIIKENGLEKYCKEDLPKFKNLEDWTFSIYLKQLFFREQLQLFGLLLALWQPKLYHYMLDLVVLL
jgi:hypothetical protein